MTPALISKSTYLSGLQCHKLAWNLVHIRDQMPGASESAQAIFDQGQEVGNVAKQLFPEGIEIAEGIVSRTAVAQWTAEALNLRKPLFEAGFIHNGAYARVDILVPAGTDAWDILEVKSSTQIKDVFVQDVAFQMSVLTGSGLKIRRCIVLHVNNRFVKRGKVDPERFFTQVDVTDEAEAQHNDTLQGLVQLQGVLSGAEPTISIGPHCSSPYGCALQERCWSFLPNQNVFTLSRGGKKAFQLLNSGVHHLRDIPDDFPLTGAQVIQRTTAISGKPHLDPKQIKLFLQSLKYPLAYMDFETFATAIPMFDELRPYQRVPFQYSLHIQPSPGAACSHHAFLADGKGDPRREFLESLKTAVPEKGSVVVYNASFEKSVLKESIDLLPEFSRWVGKVNFRIVDLWLPFRKFEYYHPDQCGSSSIKKVLPALTGRDYGELAIQDGDTASREYVRTHLCSAVSCEREKVRRQLLEYCCLDTQAMVDLLAALERHIAD